MQCGGPAYWAIALSLVPLTAVVSSVSAAWLTRKYRLKAAAGRRLPKGEVRARSATRPAAEPSESLPAPKAA